MHLQKEILLAYIYLANKSSRFFATASAYQWSPWAPPTTWPLPSRPEPSPRPTTLPSSMVGVGAWYWWNEMEVGALSGSMTSKPLSPSAHQSMTASVLRHRPFPSNMSPDFPLFMQSSYNCPTAAPPSQTRQRLYVKLSLRLLLNSHPRFDRTPEFLTNRPHHTLRGKLVQNTSARVILGWLLMRQTEE